ncbi:MAG: DEAD/DEAH box helicase [Candidatus Bathyarchaeota archaeon]|uniref:DEAD/DEAH box helicase n=2 Tax=Candidatus Bathycorpusculum sp. TaxID=2994959 RepID=UPI0028194B41|nr:DEAD/DEAH box helicase [Candidatus Termiticorpusculum sp.]
MLKILCAMHLTARSKNSTSLNSKVSLVNLDLATSESSLVKSRRSKKALIDQAIVEEKTVLCSFEEEFLSNKKVNHYYTCTYSDSYNIKKLVASNLFESYKKFKLNLAALQIKNTGQIDQLLALDAIQSKLVPYNFQMQTALQVINEMNANAILADEVGLGKTIEAGLIMKELILRGEVNSILIVSPKSLLSQWKAEMDEKFGETFFIANYPGERVNFKNDNRLICSHSLLVRKFEEFSKRTWDLIVVDEAHAFRNTHSKGRTCLGGLRKNHLLMLTATPLCNKLTDIYSIADLIHPGVLDSERAFISRFAEDSKSRVVKEEAALLLRRTLQDMMCRTRREQTGIPFTKRIVESRTLEANPLEREFIDQATLYLQAVSQNKFKTIETLMAENPNRKISGPQSHAILVFQAITLHQSFSSSPEAAIESLKRRQQRFPLETQDTDKLIEMAKKVKSAKIDLLRNILKQTRQEQALIFCLRKITAHKLKDMLNQEFGRAEVYLGNMNQVERDKVIEAFKKGDIQYLIATDAAAEGLNLQNCALMFNYDLHWNPMKIEQRIGRIHRFKQDRDVTIFNLAVKDTVDDYVLHILYQKIELFTMTVGKMETVLAELKEGDQDIQKTIAEILLRSNSRIDIQKELEKLADNLNKTRNSQELAEQFTQGVID